MSLSIPRNSRQRTGKQERKEIDAIYTPLAEALVELGRRRSSSQLRALMGEYHRTIPPSFMAGIPVGVVFRHIITPTHEFRRFVTAVQEAGLQPLCLEYRQDVFRATNRDKYRLCRPGFTLHSGQARGLKISDFGGMEGRQLGEFTTKNGLHLVDWHRALLEHVYPGFGGHIVDFSDWFSQASRDEFFYLRYLTLFICDGILFENFITDDMEELRFARERVIPSFTKAIELFGVRPLIVPLLPRESESDDYWRCHDGALYVHALNLLRQRHAPDR